jgi:hypothetical protein
MQTHIKPGTDARRVYKIKPRSWGSITMVFHNIMNAATGNGTSAASLVDVSKVFSANSGTLEQ